MGEPTKTNLESGRNVPKVTDWASPVQIRPGHGRNESMVLVYNKPEQPSLEEDWPLLCRFEMVTDNSMFLRPPGMVRPKMTLMWVIKRNILTRRMEL